MKNLIYLVFLNLFAADWLIFKLNILPREVAWFPEIASFSVFVYILSEAARKKVFYIKFKYLLCIGFFLITMLCGFILNNVGAGVMLSGMRIYLRYIPFFLLPAVWKISDKEFFRLLKFFLLLAFLQLPVVLYQRFILYSTSISGDPMGGTLGANTSGVLSALLLLAIACYIAFYLKDQISFPKFIIGFLILLLPTTMNETKITFFLLPVCFIFPLIFGKVNKDRIHKTIILFSVMAIALIGLKTIYDYFVVKRWGYGFAEFVQQKGRLQGYADMRLVPFLKTLKYALSDPVFFFFGVGAGNASSSFAASMTGAYVGRLSQLGLVILGAIILLWELGFAGIMILLTCLLLVFLDAVKLSRKNHLYGALGLAIVNMIPLYCVLTFYNNLINAQVINIPFWLLAGFIAQQAGLETNEKALKESKDVI